jgi:hypothetical protein
VARPARVYDYWLGGKDHFAADREAAEQVIGANPTVLPGVRANRVFLGRAGHRSRSRSSARRLPVSALTLRVPEVVVPR